MREPFSTFHEFYGDLDCSHREARSALRLKVLEVGRNVCFGGGKGGGGSAPSPDPKIGEAALKQAETGQDWLNFARDQFNVGNERQSGIDSLGNRLTEKQIETIERSNAWAQEDRNIQADYRAKYDQWADEDRATGQQYRKDFAGIGKDALAKGSQYQDQFLKSGADALAQGQKYQGIFDQQAQRQYDFADEQTNRYRNTYVPMEERFARDAQNWDSADRQSKMAAEARADVLSSAAGAQQQQQRQMASMGIDPRSGRYAAANSELGLQTALSAAGAQNMARDNVRTQGMALRGTAIDMGRGVQAMGQQASQLGMAATQSGNNAYNTGQQLNMQAKGAAHSAYNSGVQTSLQANNLGLAASGVGNTAASLGMGNQGGGYTGLGLGVNAGQAAMNTTLGANSAFQQNGSAMNAGFGGAMQGYAGQASTLNSLYGNQLQAWSAQKQADAAGSAGMMGGIGGILGGGAQLYSAFSSSKKIKENKRPVGGALDAVERMPVEKWKYKDGVEDGGEHIGPYAEDFKKETGLGDGESINVIDAIGLGMKATQELSAKVDKLASAGKAKPKSRTNARAKVPA